MSIKLYKHYDIFHLYRAKIIYIAFLFWEICKSEEFFSRISKENTKIISWYSFFRLFARSHVLTGCNLKEWIRWVDQPLLHSHPKQSTQICWFKLLYSHGNLRAITATEFLWRKNTGCWGIRRHHTKELIIFLSTCNGYGSNGSMGRPVSLSFISTMQ